MIKNLVKNSKKKKGFTLVELIIVIAVMSIIAGFAIPNFIKVQNNSKIDADINLGRSIAHEVEILVTEGTIPKNAAGTGYDDITLLTKNTDGIPTGNTDAIPKRIQGDIKQGTLKLQTKGASSSLTIKIDANGAVTSIQETATAANTIYPSGGGIYVK